MIAWVLIVLQVLLSLNLNTVGVSAWGLTSGNAEPEFYDDDLYHNGTTQYDPVNHPGQIPYRLVYQYGNQNGFTVGPYYDVIWFDVPGTFKWNEPHDEIWAHTNRYSLTGDDLNIPDNLPHYYGNYESFPAGGGDIEYTFTAPKGYYFSKVIDHIPYSIDNGSGIMYKFVRGTKVHSTYSDTDSESYYTSVTYKFKVGSALVNDSGNICNELSGFTFQLRTIPRVVAYNVYNGDVENKVKVADYYITPEEMDGQSWGSVGFMRDREAEFSNLGDIPEGYTYKGNVWQRYGFAEGVPSGDHTYESPEVLEEYKYGENVQDNFLTYRDYFFFNFDKYELEHNIKYQVVDTSGNPVAGVSLFGEETNAEGFVTKEDNLKFERDASDYGNPDSTGRYTWLDNTTTDTCFYYINGVRNHNCYFKIDNFSSAEKEVFPYISSIKFNVVNTNTSPGPHAVYKGSISKDDDSDTDYNIVPVDDTHSIIQFVYHPVKETEVTIKYQAVHSDGTPNAGVSYRNDVSGDDGYFTSEDKIKQRVTCRNDKRVYVNNDSKSRDSDGYYGSYSLDNLAKYKVKFTSDGSKEHDYDYDSWSFDWKDIEPRLGTLYNTVQLDANTYVIQIDTDDKVFTYDVKFKAEHNDGSPAVGYSIKGETTGADGFIEGKDVIKVVLKPTGNLECYLNDSSRSGYGNIVSFSYETSHNAKYKYNYSYANRVVTFSDITAEKNCSIKDIVAGESATVVINVDDIPKEKNADVPVKIEYYVKDNETDTDYIKVHEENDSFNAEFTVTGGGAVNKTGSKTSPTTVSEANLNKIFKHYANSNNATSRADLTEVTATNIDVSNVSTSNNSAYVGYDYAISKDISVAGNEASIVFKLYFDVSLVPEYTLTIKDEYYELDGTTLEHSDIRDTKVLLENAPYSYDALTPVGYTCTSDLTYSGTMSADTTITFTYRKDSDPAPPAPPTSTKYNVKVIDKYVDSLGFPENQNTRVDIQVEKGRPYNYSALSVAGYTPDKEGYSGVVNDDIVLIFTYKKDTIPVIPPIITPVTPSIPQYTIKVIDRIVDENGNTKDTVREEKEVLKDTPYHYESKDIPGCTPDKKEESGIVYNDTVVVFTYTKEEHTIEVIDRLVDEDGNEEDTIREEKKVPEGTPYYYESKDIPGYTPDKDKEEGTVTDDTVIIFIYHKIPVPTATPAATPVATPKPTPEPIKTPEPTATPVATPVATPEPTKTPEPTGTPDVPKPAKYILRVFDKYFNARGTKIKSVLRVHKVVDYGDDYSYKALDEKDYTVVGKDKYSGTIKSDTTLVFKYQENAKDYKIDVIDKYIVVRTAPSISSTFGGFTRKKYGTRVEKGGYSYNITRRERCSDTYAENAEYDYKALEDEKFNVVGKTEYSGKLNKNKTIEFVYLLKGYAPEDIPDEVWEESPDPIPYAPEPKTGDDNTSENKPVYSFIMISALAVTGLTYKRRKRSK